MKDEKREELSFEDSLAKLEGIVQQLERGEAPLETGLTLFEEGVALSRRCHELLRVAEERVQKLSKGADGELRLTLFEPDESDE